MKKIILITAILLLSVVVKLNAQELNSEKNTSEWYYRGSMPSSYTMGPENGTEFSNHNVLKIKSIEDKIDGFGTIMKTIKSDLYLGKTVKMSGYVKSESVKSWAGLWMRVDYYSAEVLAFDNMRDRKIRKTKDWTKYEVVLFVPMDATSLSYGVLLDGTGQIWFKDVTLEVVDDAVPETGFNNGRNHKVVSFETKAKAIASEIKRVTEDEKKALKLEIEAIDNDVAKGIISSEKAGDLKLKKATEHAAIIETKVAIQESKLNQLIQDKVDGKFENEKADKVTGTMVVLGSSNDSIGKNRREINITSMKVYNGQEDKLNRHSKRTTSQIVFAAGINNLVTAGSVAKSDFRYWGSHFYELGLTYNTRIFKNNNLLHAKYGFSAMYNNLRATNNRSFTVNGDQTNLQGNFISLDDSRFRTVSLVVPVHLEFDFSGNETRDGKPFYKKHDSFRLGVGGYIGANVKAKQIISYQENGNDVVNKERGDFNQDKLVYGLSTYIGYQSTSLYLKYDLSPLFKDNDVKQNNVSLGVRFDFN